MTVESDITTALNPLVADQVFPDVATEGHGIPYIVYTGAGGEVIVFLDNTSANRQNLHLQISVWAKRRIQANAIAAQAAAALQSSTAFQATPFAEPVWRFDEETNLFGTTQDFSLWHQRQT